MFTGPFSLASSAQVLLVMPIVGISDAVGRWLPTHLGGSLGALTAGDLTATDYLPAAAVTGLATGGLLWLAVWLTEKREL